MTKEMKDLGMSVLLLGAGFVGGYLLYKAISGKDPLKSVATTTTTTTPTATIEQVEVAPTEEEIAQAVAETIIE
jgi:uncharacterized membrane protein